MSASPAATGSNTPNPASSPPRQSNAATAMDVDSPSQPIASTSTSSTTISAPPQANPATSNGGNTSTPSVNNHNPTATPPSTQTNGNNSTRPNTISNSNPPPNNKGKAKETITGSSKLTDAERALKLEEQKRKRAELVAKKDKTLGEFLVMLEDYEPLVGSSFDKIGYLVT